jgi:16S rRNA (uracil1498-N3)-methyltransferase
MPRVAVYAPHMGDSPASITIEGDEAHHVLRVRRLAIGDHLEALDGGGRAALCRIESTEKTREGGWRLLAKVVELKTAERTRPQLHVLTSAPKGDHLVEMVSGLSQVGAASWRSLRTHRTIIEPGANKHERLNRVAVESMKQCGRAWLLEIRRQITLSEALREEAGHGVIVADASGEAYSPLASEPSTLIIGPEGGFTPEELDEARDAGARIARFGPHVMRIETAALAAAAIILHRASRG